MKNFLRFCLIVVFSVLGMYSAQGAILRTTDYFTVGEESLSLDFVTIGNPGNAADDREDVYSYSRPDGAVDYEYRIGTYEITNKQWDAFVVAAGEPTGQPSAAYGTPSNSTASELNPVNNVSWYEAAHFVNALNIIKGYEPAYSFDVNGNFLLQTGGGYRNPEAFYFLPSNDEWYKAAYYDLDSDTYYNYANGSNSAPTNDENGSNYQKDGVLAWVDGGHLPYPYVWEVGTGAMEQNGTWDMMGNVEEWLETARDETDDLTDEWRGRRGGTCTHSEKDLSVAWLSGKDSPSTQTRDIGFRVASKVPAHIAGDANNDGKVDGSDVTILAGNWQVGVGGVGGATWEMGDFNSDGAVDGSDVTILAGNWQYGVVTAATSVPEPSVLLSLLILCGFADATRFMRGKNASNLVKP